MKKINFLIAIIFACFYLVQAQAQQKTKSNAESVSDIWQDRFATVQFTKIGESKPTYTMQLMLPAGASISELLSASQQAKGYTAQETASVSVAEGIKRIEAGQDYGLPYFDKAGKLLSIETEEGVVLTFTEANAVASDNPLFLGANEVGTNILGLYAQAKQNGYGTRATSSQTSGKPQML